ncbi:MULTISPECIES: hypothetical protein [unclassified Sphingobacterium]|uniref:hypothetical protein n=1 Tax=unclassified Sphingobacterium TaxID=2609468 RepID=UPI0020C45297|nr:MULTISPECIES: hypothetical protein [unclassified Sphingobacterium]
MKKILLILTLSFTFLSCSKDEAQVDDQTIIGNWVDVNGDKWVYLNLKSNGNFEFSICSSRNEDNECLATGKYIYSNKSLALKAGYKDFVFDVDLISSNELTITDTDNYFKTISYKRK